MSLLKAMHGSRASGDEEGPPAGPLDSVQGSSCSTASPRLAQQGLLGPTLGALQPKGDTFPPPQSPQDRSEQPQNSLGEGELPRLACLLLLGLSTHAPEVDPSPKLQPPPLGGWTRLDNPK